MSYWIAGAAAVGALMDRKQPLRGAALGAGLMATGGAAAGAYGGAAGAAGTAGAGATGAGITAGGAGTAAGMGGSLGGGITAGGGGLLGATGTGTGIAAGSGTAGGMGALGGTGAGITGALPTTAASSPSMMATGMEYMKTAGQALNTANAAKSMFMPQERPMQVSPVMQNMPNNSLGQLVSNFDQQQMQRDQMQQQQRMARRQMIRGLI